MHPQTLERFGAAPDCTIVGVGLIRGLFQWSWSPASWLFMALYALCRWQRFPALTWLLARLWWWLGPLATDPWRRFRGYLQILADRRIRVLDFDNPASVEQFLRTQSVQLLLVNVWGMIGKELLAVPGLKAVNVHPSALPRYRGALPTLWALRNGDRESAVSYITLGPGADTGDLLAQHPFPIAETEDALALEDKIDNVLQATLLTDVRAYLRGDLQPRPQPATGMSKTGRYQDYRRINWAAETARDIVNKIRLYPFLDPGTWCHTGWHDGTLLVRGGALGANETATEPGAYHVVGSRLRIQACDGVVLLRLFRDLSWSDSLALLFRRRGQFKCG